MQAYTKIVIVNCLIIYAVIIGWIVYEWVNAPILLDDEEMNDFDK